MELRGISRTGYLRDAWQEGSASAVTSVLFLWLRFFPLFCFSFVACINAAFSCKEVFISRTPSLNSFKEFLQKYKAAEASTEPSTMNLPDEGMFCQRCHLPYSLAKRLPRALLGEE
jgi:hypothetical protein